MTFGQLLLRNLVYHWRGNLAVLLGVAVGTAVLTGALLVGDSLRGSLRDRTLEQLGWVEHALVAGRFFREDLAAEPRDLGASRASPVVILQGAITTAAPEGTAELPHADVQRVPRITIVGVRDDFWPAAAGPADADFWQSDREEVVLNAALARELGVVAGGTVALHLQKTSTVPRETPLGHREAGEVVDDWRVTVRAVVPDGTLGLFSLTPSPATPRNVFVPLHSLQARLDQKGRVNALLVAGAAARMEKELRQAPTADDERVGKVENWLQEHLQKCLTLDDWGLILRDPQARTDALLARLDKDHDGRLEYAEWHRHIADKVAEAMDPNHGQPAPAPTPEIRRPTLTRDEVSAYYRSRGHLSLESRQMLLEPDVADAARAAAADTKLTAAPTLVYLANSISDGKESIPYSVVAALDPGLPPPLGPFLPPGVKELKDDQIILAAWADSPLHAKPGDAITLTYFEPEEQAELRETTATFTLAGTVPLEGAAADPDLSPEFPGITDKLGIKEWSPPFPYHHERIHEGDERYWEQYRTTPKAYLTLAAGQKLWHSRFGELTSIRLAPRPAPAVGQSPNLTTLTDNFRRSLLEHLHPEQGGFVFDPVRRRALDASSGSVDFGTLFLCFSGFLIAAALLLVGLLFRLNLDRRAAELGVLLAAGFRRGAVRWLLLAEGAVLAAVGGAVGLAAAVGYAWLLLEFLRSRWQGSLDQSFLRLHATPLRFAIGYAAALVVSLLTVLWAVFVMSRVAPRALLTGATADEQVPRGSGRVRWSAWLAGVAAVGALACAAGGYWVTDPDGKAMTFFGSGALLLTAALAAVWVWMRGTQHAQVGGHGGTAVGRLGVRNAARHPVRSLLTAGLLAAAAFLIVAVESFHRDPGADFFTHHGGSGGFALMAETDVPVYQDLNNAEDRDKKLNFSEKDSAALADVQVFPFRVRAGEDISCLNLYQPHKPRLLGVPHALVERGGFRFQETEKAEGDPWRLLEEPLPDGAVPVFGEADTVTYVLNSGLGKDVQVPDESGRPVTLRIVGLLKDSVFQSQLLMSEETFLRLYPRQEGYQLFLVQVPPMSGEQRQKMVTRSKQALEDGLAPEGVVVETTERRLETYLAVVNTYLATFQALGDLGLLLGALGLAVVLLRSVWERRGELALLRALGFRRLALGWLVLAENGFLLALGLAAGTITALLAVMPHVVAGTGAVPLLRLLELLGLVLAVGLTAAALATAATLRAPLLNALRRE